MSIDSPIIHSPEMQSIRARTIDWQLGAASERFFGEGFTRVRHDVRPTNVGSERAEFLINAHYPDDWSRKGDENQHAHLASVDAMVLAARMAEHYLQSIGVEVANCWISHCTLDPGKEVVDVSGPLSVSLEVAKPTPSDDTGISFRCQLQSFRVRMTVQTTTAKRDIDCKSDTLPGYYADGYKRVHRQLSSATSTPDDPRIHSYFTLSDPIGPSGHGGLESNHGSVVSFVDANIFAAQLGQGYVFELDGLDRASTRTLWLRKAEFTRNSPPTRRKVRGHGQCRSRQGPPHRATHSVLAHGNTSRDHRRGLRQLLARARRFRSEGAMMRIVISGTYGTGKTTQARRAAVELGLPLVAARGMRDFLRDHFDGKPLHECDYLDLLELGVRRFEGRVATEPACSQGLVSDGSSLNECAYGLGRIKFGLSLGAAPDRHREQRSSFDQAIRRIGQVFLDHAQSSYDLIVHLPIEFAIASDGHRPLMEEYRSFTDSKLRRSACSLSVPVIEASGSVAERLATVQKATSDSRSLA
ncbi:AvrD family protein [Auritidibacter ignavus]|uniref:AvrD family protein n=1 Tax=Auritidibacter ignavus TaxID=678932 RepID=UPI0015D5D664|nr:AvrD family protein [Auritidibacter ignavus]